MIAAPLVVAAACNHCLQLRGPGGKMIKLFSAAITIAADKFKRGVI
jgi:hypothetical protein